MNEENNAPVTWVTRQNRQTRRCTFQLSRSSGSPRLVWFLWFNGQNGCPFEPSRIPIVSVLEGGIIKSVGHCATFETESKDSANINHYRARFTSVDSHSHALQSRATTLCYITHLPWRLAISRYHLVQADRFEINELMTCPVTKSRPKFKERG